MLFGFFPSSDWHYCHLAQMMDAKTAIALSRLSNSNLKFFLKPPNNIVKKSFNDTVDDIYQLLLKLDQLSSGKHRCLTKFINEKFQDYQQVSLFIKKIKNKFSKI